MIFSCWHCGLRIECDDLLAGYEAACPECQGPVEVPAAPEQSADPTMADQDAGEVMEAPVPPPRPRVVAEDDLPASPVPPREPLIGLPQVAPPPPGKRIRHRVCCVFIGLLLLLCLLMGAAGLQLFLLSFGHRSGPGSGMIGYLVCAVIFLWFSSLLMRGYRKSYRRVLGLSLSEFRGAFGLRMKPTEGKNGLFLGLGIFLSFASIFTPFILLLAAMAFAVAFDLGAQRKLLKKLRKEVRSPEAASEPEPALLETAALLDPRGQAVEVPSAEREVTAEVEMPMPAEPASIIPRETVPSRLAGAAPYLRRFAVLAGVAGAALLFVTRPWTQYQWASLLNRVEAYESFAKRFPEDGLADRARQKIRRLRDDEVWSQAAASPGVESARAYLRDYPEGRHREEAHRLLESLIDEVWRKVAVIRFESEIREFLEKYPEASEKTIAAADALILQLTDEAWRRIALTRSQDRILAFLEKNPRASKKTVAEAEALLAELAGEARLLTSRSESEIRAFLATNPPPARRAAAEARLEQLFNDLAWIKEQDSLDYYRRFLARFPAHPERPWVEGRIIDFEVMEIADGEHVEMPRTVAQRLGGEVVKIEVRNGSACELTLRYSGPQSTKLVVPAGETRMITLVPGEYHVTASDALKEVKSAYGKENYAAGFYWSGFVVAGQEGDAER